MRQRPARWILAFAVAVLAALSVSGTAFANAPEGIPPQMSSKAVVNPNGTVTVTVAGNWVFAQDCADRYAIGWAVDWRDPSLTTYPISGTASGVHVTLHLTRSFDGVDTDLCSTSTGTTESTGPWSATHTYSSLAVVPTGQLCVNFYDMHGTVGKPSGAPSDSIAAGPGHDKDNTLEAGQWNTAADGDCTTLSDASQGVSVLPGAGSWATPAMGALFVVVAAGAAVLVVRRRRSLARVPGTTA